MINIALVDCRKYPKTIHRLLTTLRCSRGFLRKPQGHLNWSPYCGIAILAISYFFVFAKQLQTETSLLVREQRIVICGEEKKIKRHRAGIHSGGWAQREYKRRV